MSASVERDVPTYKASERGLSSQSATSTRLPFECTSIICDEAGRYALALAETVYYAGQDRRGWEVLNAVAYKYDAESHTMVEAFKLSDVSAVQCAVSASGHLRHCASKSESDGVVLTIYSFDALPLPSPTRKRGRGRDEEGRNGDGGGRCEVVCNMSRLEESIRQTFDLFMFNGDDELHACDFSSSEIWRYKRKRDSGIWRVETKNKSASAAVDMERDVRKRQVYGKTATSGDGEIRFELSDDRLLEVYVAPKKYKIARAVEIKEEHSPTSRMIVEDKTATVKRRRRIRDDEDEDDGDSDVGGGEEGHAHTEENGGELRRTEEDPREEDEEESVEEEENSKEREKVLAVVRIPSSTSREGAFGLVPQESGEDSEEDSDDEGQEGKDERSQIADSDVETRLKCAARADVHIDEVNRLHMPFVRACVNDSIVQRRGTAVCPSQFYSDKKGGDEREGRESGEDIEVAHRNNFESFFKRALGYQHGVHEELDKKPMSDQVDVVVQDLLSVAAGIHSSTASIQHDVRRCIDSLLVTLPRVRQQSMVEEKMAEYISQNYARLDIAFQEKGGNSFACRGQVLCELLVAEFLPSSFVQQLVLGARERLEMGMNTYQQEMRKLQTLLRARQMVDEDEDESDDTVTQFDVKVRINKVVVSTLLSWSIQLRIDLFQLSPVQLETLLDIKGVSTAVDALQASTAFLEGVTATVQAGGEEREGKKGQAGMTKEKAVLLQSALLRVDGETTHADGEIRPAGLDEAEVNSVSQARSFATLMNESFSKVGGEWQVFCKAWKQMKEVDEGHQKEKTSREVLERMPGLELDTLQELLALIKSKDQKENK